MSTRRQVRDAFAELARGHVTDAQRVYPLTADDERVTQPFDFSGESPVIVVASAGSARPQKTLRGTIPIFYLDIHLFVRATAIDGDGNTAGHSDDDNTFGTEFGESASGLDNPCVVAAFAVDSPWVGSYCLEQSGGIGIVPAGNFRNSSGQIDEGHSVQRRTAPINCRPQFRGAREFFDGATDCHLKRVRGVQICVRVPAVDYTGPKERRMLARTVHGDALGCFALRYAFGLFGITQRPLCGACKIGGGEAVVREHSSDHVGVAVGATVAGR